MIIEFTNKDGGAVAIDTEDIYCVIADIQYNYEAGVPPKLTGYHLIYLWGNNLFITVTESTRDYVLRMWKDPV